VAPSTRRLSKRAEAGKPAEVAILVQVAPARCIRHREPPLEVVVPVQVAPASSLNKGLVP
ncbi:MAG: hypothetical protein SWE60_22510, partial [Thermodesulfobacteriota bacterium]|nr:hypothetical protein [Thermodesulfobacteriota bacterium]